VRACSAIKVKPNQAAGGATRAPAVWNPGRIRRTC